MKKDSFIKPLIVFIFSLVYLIYYLLCTVYAFIDRFLGEYIFFLVIGLIFIALSIIKCFLFRRIGLKSSSLLLILIIPLMFIGQLFYYIDITKIIQNIDFNNFIKLISCIVTIASMYTGCILASIDNDNKASEEKLQHNYRKGKVFVNMAFYFASFLIFILIKNIKIFDYDIIVNFFIYTLVNIVIIMIHYFPLKYVTTVINYRSKILILILGIIYTIYGFLSVLDMNMASWLLGITMFILVSDFLYMLRNVFTSKNM